MKTGFVYKLVSNFTKDIYIGSTANKYLCNRLGNHHADYKRWKDGKTGYCSSFQLFKLGPVKIECLEIIKFEHTQELRMKEGEYIRKLECINKKIPGRTLAEYYQDTKEDKKEYSKNYYQNNLQMIKYKQEEKITCECGCEIARSGISTHRKSKKHKNRILAKEIISVKINDEPVL